MQNHAMALETRRDKCIFFQSKFSLFRNARATLGLFDGRVDGGNFVFPRDLACICSKVGVISLSACDDFIKLPNLGLKKSRKSKSSNELGKSRLNS